MSDILKVGTTFSGIGAPEQALKNLKIPHIVKWACDNDKYCKETYFANHTCEKWYDDITTIDLNSLEYVDLYIFGFPCQDVSIAGKKDLKVGRTILVDFSLNIIDKISPKYFVFENVNGLLSSRFKDFFNYIVNILSINYIIQYKILNSKDFGIPQNRKRVFCVGIRKDIHYSFRFPDLIKLDIRLKDLLEEKVSNEYFINKSIKKLKPTKNSKNKLFDVNNGGQGNRVYSVEKESITLTGLGGGLGGKTGLYYIGDITDKDYDYPTPHSQRVYSIDGLGICLNSSCGNKTGQYLINNKIRMLTERECARLQGFSDSFTIPVSRSQAYKQFGNTITVTVLESIFRNLLKEYMK